MAAAKKDIDEERFIAAYDAGTTISDLAAEYNVGKTKIVVMVRRLTAQGKLKPRRKGDFNHKRRTELYEQVYEHAKNGLSKEEICEKTGASLNVIYCICKEIREAYGIEVKTRINNAKRYVDSNSSYKVPSTLPEGKTVKCSQSISRTCVYGAAKDSVYLCNYCLITKECRSLGSDGCGYEECNRYSKISKTNPRIEVRL